MPIESLVVGLSGEEIITDILFQIEQTLRKDCNLRPSDCYSQGYSGKITLDLKLSSVDTIEVKVEQNVAATPDLKKIAEEEAAAKAAAESAKVAAGVPVAQTQVVETPVEVKETIDIDPEPDVNAVRERSGQGIPMEAIDQEGQPQVRRRRYTKVESSVGPKDDVLETEPEKAANEPPTSTGSSTTSDEF